MKAQIERRSVIRSMRAEGKTLQQIGDALGISRERVRQVCVSIGATKPQRPVNAPARRAPRRVTMFREIREPVVLAGMRDPYPAYKTHKFGSRYRGIEFKLTFLQWWDLWRDHWADRGRGSLSKVMCRQMDAGAYEVGNVSIKTVRENGHDRALAHRWTKGVLRTHASAHKSQGYFHDEVPKRVYSED